MIGPPEHKRERERLRELESYNVMDTLPEHEFDNLTAIAAQICGTPISLISLVDDTRQWFKSHHGLAATETPKEVAFCAHAINQAEPVFVVEDATKDERFHDNPLVTDQPKVIFYAGVPLVTDAGLPLGTLCVIDNEPRTLNAAQLAALEKLGEQVMSLLNLRRQQKELETTNEALERFAYVAAHDIKAPLRHIATMAGVFADAYQSKLDHEALGMLNIIEKSAVRLHELVDGLLAQTQLESIPESQKSRVTAADIQTDLDLWFPNTDACCIQLEAKLDELYVNKTALQQVLINLVNNAIKYNDKPVTHITVALDADDTHYVISVTDNGPGIPEGAQQRIFEPFQVAADTDRFGNDGNGIGLATVQRIATRLGGTVLLDSNPGQGATFSVSLKR